MRDHDALTTLRRAYGLLPNLWTGAMDGMQRRRFGRGRAGMRLDVVTSVGGRDADILQVMMASLARSHPGDDIVLWLLHLGLTPAQQETLQRYAASLDNLRLELVAVARKEAFRHLSALGGRPFGARFLWLVAHQELPTEIGRAIYLDPLDTLVMDDLAPFLHHPFMGRYLVACREIPSRPPLIVGPARQASRRSDARLDRVVLGVMNSGSIVLNLAKMRKDGLTLERYLDTAEWARNVRGLSFGDQGLYALTHGSNYLQAHDRYNFRAFGQGLRLRDGTPAVVHFAGRIPKPYNLRLSAGQEAALSTRIRQSGRREMPVSDTQRLGLRHLPYYRAWWQACADTPVHARIAPLADQRTAALLAGLGIPETTGGAGGESEAGGAGLPA